MFGQSKRGAPPCSAVASAGRIREFIGAHMVTAAADCHSREIRLAARITPACDESLYDRWRGVFSAEPGQTTIRRLIEAQLGVPAESR